MQSLCTRVRVLCAAGALAAATAGTLLAANADHVQQFKSTGSCERCDLQEAVLSGLQAPGAQLAGANLARADLYGANLSGANLAGAVLDGANLKLANLSGAVDAVLTGAETDERTVCPNGSQGPCN